MSDNEQDLMERRIESAEKNPGPLLESSRMFGEWWWENVHDAEQGLTAAKQILENPAGVVCIDPELDAFGIIQMASELVRLMEDKKIAPAGFYVDPKNRVVHFPDGEEYYV